MTTRLVNADTPSIGGSVVEPTGVGVDATFVDVWCPGSVASAPSGVVSGGGVLYTPSTPAGSGDGVSGGVLSVPWFCSGGVGFFWVGCVF